MLWPRNSTSRYLSRRDEDLWPQQFYLYQPQTGKNPNIHPQKEKLWYKSFKYYPARKKNKLLIYTATRENPKIIMLSVRNRHKIKCTEWFYLYEIIEGAKFVYRNKNTYLWGYMVIFWNDVNV